MMAAPFLQDAQIFKERCEDSPGILVLCQGDWRPTPDRVNSLEALNYKVITAANGYQDIVDWLPQPCCIGAMFAHPSTVEWARNAHPDKIIDRFEGVGARFLRSLTQELPFALHNAGAPFDAVTPAPLKTVDVVSVFSPVPLKRGHLLIEALLAADATAYLFAQSLGANPELLASFLASVRAGGHSIDYLHYPFDPYAVLRIAGRIVIDGRPIGANNSIVSAYLARARLYVHTSTTEGLSNSVMEALMNDVPVMICEDIRGPLQDLSQQLPDCFTRSPPDAKSLTDGIHARLLARQPAGSIRQSFLSVIDPFEINRRVVRRAQIWYEKAGLPWKGHCLGLLGGVQSRIDLNDISAWTAYRGGSHIYPNATDAERYLDFQLSIAKQSGQLEAAESLQAEQAVIRGLVPAPLMLDGASPLDHALQDLMSGHSLKAALVIGASSNNSWTQLIARLAAGPEPTQIICLESQEQALQQLRLKFAGMEAVKCLIAASVSATDLPAAPELTKFYGETPSLLRQYPLAAVLGWLHQDISLLESGLLPDDGISQAARLAAVERFDLVIIDGMEFSGSAELDRAGDCNMIVLGCTRTFKNWANFERLTADPRYEMTWHSAFQGNGIALFRRRTDMHGCGGTVPSR